MIFTPDPPSLITLVEELRHKLFYSTANETLCPVSRWNLGLRFSAVAASAIISSSSRPERFWIRIISSVRSQAGI